jgi:hypothetical protein
MCGVQTIQNFRLIARPRGRAKVYKWSSRWQNKIHRAFSRAVLFVFGAVIRCDEDDTGRAKTA